MRNKPRNRRRPNPARDPRLELMFTSVLVAPPVKCDRHPGPQLGYIVCKCVAHNGALIGHVSFPNGSDHGEILCNPRTEHQVADLMLICGKCAVELIQSDLRRMPAAAPGVIQ